MFLLFFFFLRDGMSNAQRGHSIECVLRVFNDPPELCLMSWGCWCTPSHPLVVPGTWVPVPVPASPSAPSHSANIFQRTCGNVAGLIIRSDLDISGKCVPSKPRPGQDCRTGSTKIRAPRQRAANCCGSSGAWRVVQ